MSFPFFHRPGTIVFLDDDADYLEMLALVLPRHWHIKLFLRPSDCITYLRQEPPFWEADAWNQQHVVDQWREGKPLIPQLLTYWAKYSERYALTRVCVVDYSMPGMDGLQALAELADWPGSRVLLTGQADEQVAVRAFNRGLIDQFIAKQTPDISRHLVDAIDRLLRTPHARLSQIWRSTLSPGQHELLRRPAVGHELATFASKRWVEHVLIGDPFGMLGMDAAGQVSWLQLEAADGLKAQAEMAVLEGVTGASLEDIRHGRKLANLELRQALGRVGPVELALAFPVGQDDALLGALFRLEPAQGPGAAASYGQWLTRQDRRSVRG